MRDIILVSPNGGSDIREKEEQRPFFADQVPAFFFFLFATDLPDFSDVVRVDLPDLPDVFRVDLPGFSDVARADLFCFAMKNLIIGM